LAKWVYENVVQSVFENWNSIKNFQELQKIFVHIKNAEKYGVDISNITIYLNHIAKKLSENDWNLTD